MRTRPVARLVVGAVLVTSVVACTGPDGSEPRVAGTVDVATPSVTASPSQPDADDGPAPADGDEGAAPGDLPTAAPVELTEVADFGTGVTAEVQQVEAIQAEGRGPGELSGPALVFRIAVTNGSGAPVDVDAVTVNVADMTGAPGAPLAGPPAEPFTGSVEPGASAVGTYVFAVPADSRDLVQLEVSYSTDASVVVFAGDPDAATRRS